MQFKKKLNNIIIGLLIIFGLGLILYPSLSNWQTNYRQDRLIEDYEADLKSNQASLNEEMERARAYNKRLGTMSIGDPFVEGEEEGESDYNSILNIGGIMAYIEIDKLGINLPIKHGVSDQVLKNFAGHLEGSSLPVGGESSHSIITAHTGYPGAELFTDIDRLELGDSFRIRVLGETLNYQVDSIDIILPTDLDKLKIYEGEDYLTLLTCTPYGINSHRLLVRGSRVDQVDRQEREFDFYKIIKYILLSIVLLLLIMPNKKAKKDS